MSFLDKVKDTVKGWFNKSSEYRFEIYKSTRKSKQPYRFRFKAPNGEIMFSGEGYTNKSDCEAAVAKIVETVGTAKVENNA